MEIVKLLNINIASSTVLMNPTQVKEQLPLTKVAATTVLQGRQAIQDIIDGKDHRKFMIVGPCSIHDIDAALEYAEKLQNLASKVNDKLLLVMRVYFEKPRTTIGWKGLINDPDLDDSFKIEKGLLIARNLLLKIAELKLPTATETLDHITPQYFSDLISWAAIGARTIESQTHREMSSGLSMPVGFKNGTDGNIQVALDAMQSAKKSHHFLGIDQTGQVCKFKTKGNLYGHIILRGGSNKPNFDAPTVTWVEKQLEALNLLPRIVIDCSHGNSYKDHKLQARVLNNVLQQIADGNKSIVGMMLESNLYEGNQRIPTDLQQLHYGVSVTDKCLGWEETEEIILSAHQKLRVEQNSMWHTNSTFESGSSYRKTLVNIG